MELKFIIPKPYGTVFTALSDMKIYADLHPLISKIVPLQGNKYVVYETAQIVFFTRKFTYPLQLEINSHDHTILFKAVVDNLVHIYITMHLKNIEENTTEVSEFVEIKSILPVKGFMQRLIKKQHTILFENLSQMK